MKQPYTVFVCGKACGRTFDVKEVMAYDFESAKEAAWNIELDTLISEGVVELVAFAPPETKHVELSARDQGKVKKPKMK